MGIVATKSLGENFPVSGTENLLQANYIGPFLTQRIGKGIQACVDVRCAAIERQPSEQAKIEKKCIQGEDGEHAA